MFQKVAVLIRLCIHFLVMNAISNHLINICCERIFIVFNNIDISLDFFTGTYGHGVYIYKYQTNIITILVCKSKNNDLLLLVILNLFDIELLVVKFSLYFFLSISFSLKLFFPFVILPYKLFFLL